ncbi:MAG: flagellar hook-basal body complex protein FliE [Planctomycetes bacterium]|nr:flagellar hook-basal body complex protein FliE [Planctomycetota bacterium]
MEPISGLNAIQSGAAGAAKTVGRLDPIDGGAGELLSIDGAAQNSNFANALTHAMDQLITSQQNSGKAVADLSAGKRDDVFAVMIDVQKAGLALQMGLEVRNKVMDAYHEVMRMTV